MNQVKKEDKYQSHAPPPCTHNPGYQTSPNQQCGYIQRGPVNFLPEGIQQLPSMTMTSTQTPQHSSNTFHYYRETLSCQQHCCMPPLPGSVQFQHEGPQNLTSMATTSTQTPHPPPCTVPYCKKKLDVPNMHSNPALPGSTGDLTACQLRNPGSSLLQGVMGASTHSSQKLTEDAVQKRELRLMRNREAARECRRKKKEYVKCLENRVDVLENQNKTLIEELKALKDIYRHKTE
ncbi:cAMP-responsive element modulator-like isoform X1 [Thunnus albacares]|uniref:cAMP-responsive element modulator-like isoform X1 n=2 Tax=Thunnus albacares TaxID=8236 RepID=UPI001CF649B9|nr:cAMP-responsive element modulator-like isoform X1 [Thunnus albacares]